MSKHRLVERRRSPVESGRPAARGEGVHRGLPAHGVWGARLWGAVMVMAMAVSMACGSAPATESVSPMALGDTEGAELAELCVEALRSWELLDDQGVAVSRTRGRCLGRVEHPEQGELWHFVAQLQDLGAEAPTWELHLWLGGDGWPRHAEFREPTRVTRLTWREGALLVRRFGDQIEIVEPEGTQSLWPMASHGLYLRELMLRLGVGVEGERVQQRSWLLDRDSLGELDMRLARDGERTLLSKGEGGPTLVFEGSSRLSTLRLNTIEVGGLLRYRSLEPGEDTLAEFLPAVPRPHYELGADLRVVPADVAAEQGKPRLGGELVMSAETASEGAGPGRPAVLFIGGAGAQDRYGFVPGSSVDIGSHEFHDELARAGFVVMRFDDRGVGSSEIGEDPTPGFADLVDDGRRALAALAARPEVDPRRLLIVGHGEGALQASILAAEGVRVGRRRRRLRGLVVLAAPGRNLRELIYDEIRASFPPGSEAEVRAVLQRAAGVHDAALAGRDLPASSEGARQWMVEAFAEQPLVRLRAVSVPVLAVQGGRDFQVSAARDFESVRGVVERGAGGSEVRLFPDLDYLFKAEAGESTPGHYGDLSRRVDRDVLMVVRDWALSRVE